MSIMPLFAPHAHEALHISCLGTDCFALQFSLAEVQAVQEGQDLIFSFADGGSITLGSFFEQGAGHPLPHLQSEGIPMDVGLLLEPIAAGTEDRTQNFELLSSDSSDVSAQTVFCLPAASAGSIYVQGVVEGCVAPTEGTLHSGHELSEAGAATFFQHFFQTDGHFFAQNPDFEQLREANCLEIISGNSQDIVERLHTLQGDENLPTRLPVLWPDDGMLFLSDADGQAVDLSVHGLPVLVVGDLTTSANLVMEGLLYVHGNLYADGGVSVHGALAVEGDLHVGSFLTADGYPGGELSFSLQSPDLPAFPGGTIFTPWVEPENTSTLFPENETAGALHVSGIIDSDSSYATDPASVCVQEPGDEPSAAHGPSDDFSNFVPEHSPHALPMFLADQDSRDDNSASGINLSDGDSLLYSSGSDLLFTNESLNPDSVNSVYPGAQHSVGTASEHNSPTDLVFLSNGSYDGSDMADGDELLFGSSTDNSDVLHSHIAHSVGGAGEGIALTAEDIFSGAGEVGFLIGAGEEELDGSFAGVAIGNTTAEGINAASLTSMQAMQNVGIHMNGNTVTLDAEKWHQNADNPTTYVNDADSLALAAGTTESTGENDGVQLQLQIATFQVSNS